MKVRMTLLLLWCLALSGCGFLTGGDRYYPGIRFHLDIVGSDFAGARYLVLDIEASNLRYRQVDSVTQPKKHYYLESSNGVAKDKAGTRLRPPVIGELLVVLPSDIVARSGSRFELTERDLVAVSYREYMFDEKDRKFITFDGSSGKKVSLAVKELSFLRDRKGFTATADEDGKDFYRFSGTIDGLFSDKELSRSRRVRGRFELKWKKEDRGS